MDLAPLEAALAAEDWPDALDRALEAWRETRHPHLAALVRSLSPRAGAHFTPPRARTSDAFERAWCEVAKSDPSALATGWLAETFAKKIASPMAPFVRRGPLLANRPPDPRVATALVEVLRVGKHGAGNVAGSRSIYLPLVRILERIEDATVARDIAQIAETPRAPRASTRKALQALLPPLAETLTTRVPRGHLDETALAALVSPHLTSSLSPAATEAASVHAYVLANPDDEDARAVLGDAWQAAGASQGELVTLERRGLWYRDKAWKRLVRAHLKDWLGEDIASVIANPRFRGGLLDECSLRPTSSASRATWERVLSDERMATLQRCWIGRGSHTWYPRLVASPTLRGLRHVELRTELMVETVLDGPPRPYTGVHFRYAPGAARLRGLSDRFDTIREIGVPHDMSHRDLHRLLDESGWQRRVTAIGFEDVPFYEGVEIDVWHADAPRTPIITELSWFIEQFPKLERLTVTRDSYHYEMAVSYLRTDDGWVLELDCDPWTRDRPQEFRDHFQRFTFEPGDDDFLRLPEAVTAVRIRRAPDDAFVERLQAAWPVSVTAIRN